MEQEKIELRKVRDFGEIINDTFIFFRQTWKPLLKSYVVICGFFVIAGIITAVMYQVKIKDAISSSGSQDPTKLMAASMFSLEYLFTLIFAFLSYTAVSLTTLSFIHLYKEKGNEAPDVEEVWTFVKFFFFRFLGSGLLIGILLMFGMLLCIIPGIYLWPVVALIFPIMLIEGTSLGYAFNRCFKLIKGHWWTTFGSQVIIMIILSAGSFVIMVPLAIMGGVDAFISPFKSSMPMVILSAIVQNLNLVFLILPTISITLSYYSLTEQKDGIGLMDRINSLGNKDAFDKDLPKEEY